MDPSYYFCYLSLGLFAVLPEYWRAGRPSTAYTASTGVNCAPPRYAAQGVRLVLTVLSSLWL